MKKHVIIVVIIFSMVSCGVPKIVTTPVNQYQKEVEAPGTKEEIYVRSNEWMVKMFNDAKSVIQFQDKEQGTIIGKYLLHSTKMSVGYGMEIGDDIFGVIKIMVKDNRAKIIIEPQAAWKYGQQGIYTLDYSSEMAETDISNIIKNFSDFIIRTNEW